MGLVVLASHDKKEKINKTVPQNKLQTNSPAEFGRVLGGPGT